MVKQVPPLQVWLLKGDRSKATVKVILSSSWFLSKLFGQLSYKCFIVVISVYYTLRLGLYSQITDFQCKQFTINVDDAYYLQYSCNKDSPSSTKVIY